MVNKLINPVFLLRLLNASVMRWPASIVIINLFYSIIMTIMGKGSSIEQGEITAMTLPVILFSVIWGCYFTIYTPPLYQRKNLGGIKLAATVLYAFFCFISSSRQSGIIPLIFFFCAVEGILNAIIMLKSDSGKSKKSYGEALIDVIKQGKISTDDLLNHELRAVCEAENNHEAIEVIDEVEKATDKLLDSKLKYIKNKSDEGCFILPKKTYGNHTYTKLSYSEGEALSSGIIVTKLNIFSVTVVYDKITFGKKSPEMFSAKRANGQEVDVRPYISRLLEPYIALMHIFDLKHPITNIVVANNNEGVFELVHFRKVPIIVMGMKEFDDFIIYANKKGTRYTAEQAKELFEQIKMHIKKEDNAQ